MPVMKLTKRTVDGLQPTQRQTLYRDTDLTGFAVRVSTKTKTYIAVRNGKEFTLGRTDLLEIDEARQRAKRVLYEIETTGQAPERKPGVKLSVYMEEWLETYAKKSLKRTTFNTYRMVYRLHIKPHIGSLTLQTTTTKDVIDLFTTLEGNGHSPRAIQKVHTTLSSAFSHALLTQQVQYNPCSAAPKPRSKKPEIHTFTPEEGHKFINAAKADRYYALWVLAVTTGMRLGEMLGLRWDDINFENSRLSIRRTLVESDGHTSFDLPKTKTSFRTIELSQFAVNVLKEHPRQSEYVFVTPNGSLLRQSNLRNRHFVPLLKASELPRIRIHDLRHFAATTLISQGVHPKVVAEMLGHSSVQTTLDTYSHVLPTMHQEAADKMNLMFGGQA